MYKSEGKSPGPFAIWLLVSCRLSDMMVLRFCSTAIHLRMEACEKAVKNKFCVDIHPV